MSIKRFLGFFALLLSVFTLVGCGMIQPEDVFVRSYSDAQSELQYVFDRVFFEEADLVRTTSLVLPTSTDLVEEITYEWTSSNEAIIATNGKVTRPVIGEGDAQVTLHLKMTAKYTCLDDGTRKAGTVSLEKEWTFTILEAPKLYTIAELLTQPDATQCRVIGTVYFINTKYDKGYNNISVTILDEAGDTLYVYRLKGEVKLGDTIEVTGVITSYNGDRQIDAGATYEKVGFDEAWSTLDTVVESTIAEIKTMKANDLVKVTGTVKSIDTPWDPGYGNMCVTIEDEAGDTLYIYRTTLELNVGDNITVIGLVDVYKEKYQITQGNIATLNSSAEPKPEPDHEHVLCPECGNCTAADCDGTMDKCAGHTVAPEVKEWKVAEKLEAGKAYKLGLFSTEKNAVYYATGAMSGYYGATDTNVDNAADVYLIAVEGGFKIKVGENYVAYEVSGTHHNFVYKTTEAEGSVFTYDTTVGGLVTTESGNTVFMGTFGSYVTFGMSLVGQAATSYVGQLYELVTVGGDTPVVPEPPKHEHAVCPECGKCTAADCDGTMEKCAGHEEKPVSSNIDDFETLNGGTHTGQYESFTSAAGWQVLGAINSGNVNPDQTSANPSFGYIGGPEERAVTLNGKTTDVGYIKSPLLTTGVKSISFKYGQTFSDTNFSITVSILDKDGNEIEKYVLAWEDTGKVNRYKVQDFTWELTTPVAGEFYISIVNNCPSASTSNKDRVTVWNITWEGYEAPVEQPAEPQTVAISFSSNAQRTAYSTSEQVWTNGDVVLTNSKGAATSNIGDYVNPARFYQNTTIKIECAGMTSITFDVNSGKPVSGLTNSLAGYTFETNGSKVTVTFAEPVNSIEFVASAQFRLNSLEVTYTK